MPEHFESCLTSGQFHEAAHRKSWLKACLQAVGAVSTALVCSSLLPALAVEQSTIYFDGKPPQISRSDNPDLFEPGAPETEEDEGAKAMTGVAARQKIPCMVWTPAKSSEKIRLAMLLIHGFGLHKGSYDAFAKKMTEDGAIVYAIDVRGFGSWFRNGDAKIDFKATMEDIGLSLSEIKKLHPDLPIVVLGESMGGAIALKTAALYPDMVNGLISSVPAGDRFDKANSEIGVLKHVLAKGFNAPMEVGTGIVTSATQKPELRQAWLNDPMVRNEATPNDLIAFQKFMNNSFTVAPRIKTCPVLVIQGTKDKLVRPAGTWKLFNSIGSPNRQLVLSTNAEHLIFEAGQFNKEDLAFVRNWLNRTVTPLDSLAGNNEKKKSEPQTRLAEKPKEEQAKNQTNKVASAGTVTAGADKRPSKPAGIKSNAAISYWIELKRDGKVFRCNNKTEFKSGDAIRFHITPESDGYAYIVLKQGSTGSTAVLFPSADTGDNNYLRRGVDYPLPYSDWLAFDENPGLEKVRILFSYQPIALEKMKEQAEREKRIAYVSEDMTGAKDLIGTRMQLSWDDPNPVIMPEDIQAGMRLASTSKVRLVFDETGEAFAVDVALLHR